MALEGTKLEGEGEGSSMNPQIAEEKQVEKARTKGWRPIEEFKGDAADWVPAKEFLGREKLFDKIHDLKNQISRQTQGFQKELAQMSAHFAKVQETADKKAVQELKAQLTAAKAAGEVDEVAEIAGQIKEKEAEVKESARDVKVAQQVARQSGPTPEFQEWQKDNKWFQEDQEMTVDAISFGTGYAAANPDKSQKDVLEYVGKKIRKVYPEKFEDAPQGRQKVEDKVEGGGNSRPAPKKKGTLSPIWTTWSGLLCVLW